MKTIRSFMTVVGVSLMLVAMGAVGVSAQTLSTTDLAGTFTLPFEAQWGSMTLPAGDYTLYYGPVNFGGISVVELVGRAAGSPHGYIAARGHDSTSVNRNVLVCVRQGDRAFVRELQMGVIGETVYFSLPRDVELLARQRNNNVYARLAEEPVFIERVPVELRGR